MIWNIHFGNVKNTSDFLKKSPLYVNFSSNLGVNASFLSLQSKEKLMITLDLELSAWADNCLKKHLAPPQSFAIPKIIFPVKQEHICIHYPPTGLPEVEYRGSPTSTVSTSTISTSTNFIAIGIKLVLVELLCNKISTGGNWIRSTH